MQSGNNLMGIVEFREKMNQNGWALFPDFITLEMVDRMVVALKIAYKRCRKIQRVNGIENSEYTVHHILGIKSVFLEFLAEFERIDRHISDYFGGKYIINSFGGNLLQKESSYANNIHRDIRSFSGEMPMMLNSIIMLSNFTPDNGSTWLMSGGHLLEEKPSEEVFKKNAFQLTGREGSLVVFNSNMWHMAGENRTDKPRFSVTPLFSRPFMKPGLDYPRLLGHAKESIYSEYLKQVLGYYSKTPRMLAEWYQPIGKRFYRSDQG